MRTIILFSEKLKFLFAADVPKLSQRFTSYTFYLVKPRLFLLIDDKINHHFTYLGKNSFFEVLYQRLSHIDAILQSFSCKHSHRV